MKRGALLVLLAACSSDPCDGVAGACVTLHVTAPTAMTIDQLELDIIYAGHHAMATTQGRASLPVDTHVDFTDPGPFDVGIVAAGKLGGNVLGAGAGEVAIAGREHAALALVLAPPPDCVAGAFYCGGDKLPGNADTLYECNAGGAPVARGVCPGACLVRPADDDACAAVGGPCVEGTTYCGGDKVDGDPQALYRCTSGAGVLVMRCPHACDVIPGQPDACE